jgi:hypothetical protein
MIRAADSCNTCKAYGCVIVQFSKPTCATPRDKGTRLRAEHLRLMNT